MPLNILLAGGARPDVIEAFADAAAMLAGGGDVIVAGGPFRRAGELDDMRRLCHARRIGLVVPTIDDDLPLWSAMSGGLADSGTLVAVSPTATIALCHDRYLATRSLAALGFPAAPAWLPAQVSPELPMPVVVSARTPRTQATPVVIDRYTDLDRYLTRHPDTIVQPLPQGPLVDVDVCCDASGRLTVVGHPEFAEVAVSVTAALHIMGAAAIQAAIEGDRLVIRNVSARFSGRLAGGVPRALVELAVTQSAHPLWMDGLETAPVSVMGAVA